MGDTEKQFRDERHIANFSYLCLTCDPPSWRQCLVIKTQEISCLAPYKKAMDTERVYQNSLLPIYMQFDQNCHFWFVCFFSIQVVKVGEAG